MTENPRRLYEWLERLSEHDAIHSEIPEFRDLSRVDRLDLTEQLLDHGWVVAIPLYGDDRLMSVRDVRVTAAGRAALQNAISLLHQGRTDRMDSITEKRANRFAFMHALYEETDGSKFNIVEMSALGESLGWTREETQRIVEYLEGEGLVQYMTIGGGISITHLGAVEVEEAMTKPDSPTEHFPAYVNIVNIQGSVTNSNIAQASPGARQTVLASADAVRSLQPIVDRLLREVLPNLDATTPELDELVTELRIAQVELASKAPKADRLRGTLGRAADIMRNLASMSTNAGELGQFAAQVYDLLPGI